MVEAGVAPKKVDDYMLSKYACYLINLNGDPRKEIIAQAEIYYLDKSIGNITFKFTIYSPWDSLKNAINQVNEFMKYRCVPDDKWEILEVKRLSSIDSNHL